MTCTATLQPGVVPVVAFGPGPDGTAACSLTATKVPTGAAVAVDGQSGDSTCPGS
jgi:hypothetical protein